MEGTISEIRLFAGNFAPRNWAFCAGQIIAIQSNTALFSLLGTTYGGNGTTTFGLPNLVGRVPVGAGQAPGGSIYDLGQMGGSDFTTLNASQLPIHAHALVGALNVGTQGNSSLPAGDFLAAPPSGDVYAEELGTGTLAPGIIAGQAGPNGSGAPISITQPYEGLNYIICLFGVYPQRS